MKKQLKNNIIVAVFVIICMALFGTTAHAEKNGWVGSYYYIDGVKQKNTWVNEGKNIYYVNGKGKKLTGWHKIKGSYYFFNDRQKNGNSNKKTGVKLTKLSNKVITMGIDISEWQGSIDWEKVKDSGVKFVMIRLGYGKGRYGNKNCSMDKRFKEYVEGAGEVGIPIGIYFYSYAVTPKQAQEEAEFTIGKLDGIPVSFPVAYDIEDPYIISKTTTETRTEMTKTFMDTVEAAGYYPVYYCNQNWYNNYLDSEALDDYDFWYARYTYVEPSQSEYPFTMWQASSTQKMNGITENTVDVNFLYKDYFSKIKERTKALKYGWHTEGGKLCYYYKGKPKQSGWFSVAGNRYYFSNSAAVKGFKTIDGSRYYFNSKGEMQTGFVKVSGRYYLLSDDGVLQMTTDKPGVTIDENGVCHIKKGWYKDNKGRYFYRYANGEIAKNKWMKSGKKKYYVGNDGRRVKGFKTIKKQRYYFDKNGVMKKGWLTYNGKKYYFKSNGQMVRNKTVKIKGKKYKFDKNGVLKG